MRLAGRKSLKHQLKTLFVKNGMSFFMQLPAQKNIIMNCGIMFKYATKNFGDSKTLFQRSGFSGNYFGNFCGRQFVPLGINIHYSRPVLVQ